MSRKLEIPVAIDREDVVVPMPESSGIYRITHVDAASASYIGQAQNIRDRICDHVAQLWRRVHPNAKIRRMAEELGVEGFRFAVVEECALEHLDGREQFWIAREQPSLNSNRGGGCRSREQIPDEPTTGIRIDLPPWLDQRLDEWALASKRSKRAQIGFILRQIIGCYERDPMILDRLALLSAGAVKIVSAGPT